MGLICKYTFILNVLHMLKPTLFSSKSDQISQSLKWEGKGQNNYFSLGSIFITDSVTQKTDFIIICNSMKL